MDYSINDSTRISGHAYFSHNIWNRSYTCMQKCGYSRKKSKRNGENYLNAVNVEFDDFPEVLLDKGKNIFCGNRLGLCSAHSIENVD